MRVHDSSQRGFGGAAGSGAVFDFCLSFELKTFLKKGMVRKGGRPGLSGGVRVGGVPEYLL